MSWTAIQKKSSFRNRIRSRFPEWLPIFGSHVRRIGLLRTVGGGFPMYLSLPAFILFHVFGLMIFSNWILQPLLGLEKLRFKDYIVIDRYKIHDLPWFDRLNCMYCGYANGITMYFLERLKQVSEYQGEIGFVRATLLSIGLPIYFVGSLPFRITRFIVYDAIVSHPLGLHRISSQAASAQITPCKSRHLSQGILGSLFKVESVLARKVISNLEQIESAWCPLKHLDTRPSVKYPPHHSLFFDKSEIEEMKKVLQEEGTVSSIKPYR